MFELSNEQRRCFGLPPVLASWKKVEVEPNPCDMYYTFAYLDGRRIVKVIQVYDEQPGQECYCEFGVDELLSEDGTTLLPKTQKGKPQNFTSTNLRKRTPVGMRLNYNRGHAALTNYTSGKAFYCSAYDDVEMDSFQSFTRWVDRWCRDMDERAQKEIDAFALQKRHPQKYREGDFFRFRINRTLYGYGRILLDFSQMRKKGIPFWDIFMGKPLCVAVYHAATENPDLSPDRLAGSMTLPPQMIMDNIFYYGECEIIGNLPLGKEPWDFPVHYGRTIRMGEQGIRYQCGRTFLELEGEELYPGFRNGSIGWNLDVRLIVLRECIAEHSNEPYWRMMPPFRVNQDLRNPRYRRELARIREQVGITE